MARDPVREWQEEYARRGTHLGFVPLGDIPFRSSIRSLFDAPRIVRTELSAGFLFRDRTMIGDRDDRLSLIIAGTPRFHVWHRGRELELDRGDATIFQADAPGRSGAPVDFTVVEISMPQAEWAAREARPGDLLARRIESTSEGLKLLTGYVRSLEALGTCAISDTRETIRRHVIDLAVLAATRQRPIGESGAPAVLAARRAAVMDHINARFGDPGLSIARVAEALRVSPRHVQRLLQESGTTFTAYVTEVRLQHAVALLTAAEPRMQRIADIAMEAGFSDVSYFNRLFRSHFGCAPSALRGAGPSRRRGSN